MMFPLRGIRVAWTRFAPLLLALSAAAATSHLDYAPAPVDNPLKGLVPYAGKRADPFPHSMEFNYLPLSAFVTAENTYDWTRLEKLLDEVASRGRQTIFRAYLEYPGHRDVIPNYLVQAGVKVTVRQNEAGGDSRERVETPDYADPRVVACLTNFIEALGRKYDGDPRIGYLTAGLLGTWGEWHTYPRNDLWATKEVQAGVLDAYAAALNRTPVLVRYPAGPGHHAQVANVDRPVGYHDDSFAWATLDTGKKGDSWFFLTAMKAAGATEKWRRFPIGGEIRPEAWGRVFDEKPDDPRIQDFATCVRETHATWLMDTGLFQKKTATPERRRRAEDLVRRMGYEFHVPTVTVDEQAGAVQVEVAVENRGVAPFYHDWPVEFGLLRADGTTAQVFRSSARLTGLLPGDPARIWKERLDIAEPIGASLHLALRVPNPLPNGRPVRFANRTQDQHAPGWLTLATLGAGGRRTELGR